MLQRVTLVKKVRRVSQAFPESVVLEDKTGTEGLPVPGAFLGPWVLKAPLGNVVCLVPQVHVESGAILGIEGSQGA